MGYKAVDSEYLRNKILNSEYERMEIKKVGAVTARTLADSEVVTTYFYDECAKIRRIQEEIKGFDKVLVTKSINGKEYSSVVNALTFCKTYTKTNKADLYLPVVDPQTCYIMDENLSFINVWEQEMSMSPGDMLLPFNAKLQDFYGIYKHNFDDNYEIVHNNCYGNQPDLKPIELIRRKM